MNSEKTQRGLTNILLLDSPFFDFVSKCDRIGPEFACVGLFQIPNYSFAMERIRIFGWSRLLTAGLFACMSFVLGCSRDDSGSADDRSEANASMTVTLRGETAGSRAVAPTTDPELTALEEAENALKNVTIPTYSALVYKISNELEEKEREEFTRLKVIKRMKQK